MSVPAGIPARPTPGRNPSCPPATVAGKPPDIPGRLSCKAKPESRADPPMPDGASRADGPGAFEAAFGMPAP